MKHQHDRPTNQHETEIKSRVNVRDSSSFFACVSFSPQSMCFLADFFVAVIVVSHFSPHINVAAAIAFMYIFQLKSHQLHCRFMHCIAFSLFRIGCEVFVCFVNKLLMFIRQSMTCVLFNIRLFQQSSPRFEEKIFFFHFLNAIFLKHWMYFNCFKSIPNEFPSIETNSIHHFIHKMSVFLFTHISRVI